MKLAIKIIENQINYLGMRRELLESYLSVEELNAKIFKA